MNHRIKSAVFLLVACITLAGCSTVSPNQGEQAVLVYKPMLFGHGGVDPTPIQTGLTLVALTTDAVIVNMQPQQFEYRATDLMTSDGVPLEFDSIIRLRVTDSVKLVSRFGEKWYQNNIQNEFSNRIRQAVRKHGLNETAISTTAIDAIDAEISAAMSDYITKADIPIELIKVTVGRANPPDSIKSQRVETAAQEQRIKTEEQRKMAEDSRKAAETSRAIADNAYRQSLGLSPEQFVQLENIHMQREVCQKEHCTFIVGSAIPIIK